MKPERAHVVQAVGELDQQDADVLGHRDQHLAEALGLAFARRGELDLRDLGEALDQEADLVAEEAADLARRGEGVLERVVEQTGDHRGRVESHLGEHPRHFQRMDQIGLAREPLLALVHLRREHVGALQHPEIRVGMVLQDLVGDVVEAKHAFFRRVPEPRGVVACSSHGWANHWSAWAFDAGPPNAIASDRAQLRRDRAAAPRGRLREHAARVRGRGTRTRLLAGPALPGRLARRRRRLLRAARGGPHALALRRHLRRCARRGRSPRRAFHPQLGRRLDLPSRRPLRGRLLLGSRRRRRAARDPGSR